jgi:transcription initiation factor IIE alpha subunit
MKDLYKEAGFLYIGGPGGMKCPCCDNKMSKKRKSKIQRNLFSKLRRTWLKRLTKKEISDSI